MSCLERWLLLCPSLFLLLLFCCRPPSQRGNCSPLHWLQCPGHSRWQQPAQVRAAHQRQSQPRRLIPRPQGTSAESNCSHSFHSIRHSMFICAILCHGIGLICLEAVKGLCRSPKQQSDHVSSSAEARLLYTLLQTSSCGASTVVACNVETHVDSVSNRSVAPQSEPIWHHIKPSAHAISMPRSGELEEQ